MKNASLVERMAESRMRNLLAMADARTKLGGAEQGRLAKRYTKLARLISSHYKVPVPAGLKQRICKNCGNLLVPGVNCSVRAVSSRGYMAYVCECGKEKHVFYKRRRGSLSR
ncbi:MAG: hypothetical protein KGI04_03010 [Candidatus Micrarchaeota archaeon]|nr:hypothetical protein [Candidatus Micrarchaeota archaeon]